MSRRVQLTLSLFILLILTGCGTTLRQQWYDFTAYYNTFYNTRQLFLEGERENRHSLPGLNPEQFIRIHPSPTGAGTVQFERAIETGAELLRRHSRSGYVDRTLELIGASYFYRQEYFNALETFQDLYTYTSDSERKQKASVWIARAHLELGLHSEAFRIAEFEPDSGSSVEPEIEAEMVTLLAQHRIETGELQLASELLSESLPLLENSELKTRGYFLLAQLLERLGDYNGSYLAFREVTEHRPGYELEYHSRMKEASLVRRVGNLDMARQLFRSIERDDKYLDRRPDILFEIARTETMRGETEGAIELYEQVLRPPGGPPSSVTRTKAYYELAEIYRVQFRDLETAAAYYDSAAIQNPDSSLLPEDWDANVRAVSFREFVTLRSEIEELDTLLVLGSLPENERDLILSEMDRDVEQAHIQEE
ncbi:MAG: tetratricopeptide repeat protein, partial [Balneolaceae bacterium]